MARTHPAGTISSIFPDRPSARGNIIVLTTQDAAAMVGARTMAGYVERGALAGISTLIYRHGAIAYTDVQGWHDREARLPLRRDALFPTSP